MNGLTIRSMTLEDYPDFCRFSKDLHGAHHRAYPDIFKETCPLPSQEEFGKRLEEPSRALFMAVIDGATAGFCNAVFSQAPDDPMYPLYSNKVMHIDDIYVSPEFRRQGVATALYQATVDQARAMGAQKVNLMVWDFNKGAIALYESLGMKTTFRQMETKL